MHKRVKSSEYTKLDYLEGETGRVSCRNCHAKSGEGMGGGGELPQKDDLARASYCRSPETAPANRPGGVFSLFGKVSKKKKAGRDSQ